MTRQNQACRHLRRREHNHPHTSITVFVERRKRSFFVAQSCMGRSAREVEKSIPFARCNYYICLRLQSPWWHPVLRRFRLDTPRHSVRAPFPNRRPEEDIFCPSEMGSSSSAVLKNGGHEGDPGSLKDVNSHVPFNRSSYRRSR